MKTRLLNLWQRLRASSWFLPSLLVLGALLLALAILAVEGRGRSGVLPLSPGVFRGSAEGARAVLSVVAGTMISVTGITFSTTIVTLTLASSLFGPRLLRNFMGHTGNQVVLNTAFGQIRQNARTNAAGTIRLLEIIRETALRVHRQGHRAALLRQAEMIACGSHSGLPEEEDRKDVQARYPEVLKVLPSGLN